jgi:hypothetical protein
MNQFFDTAAVFIANILRLKPTGWQEARRIAQTMRKAHLAFKAAKVIIGGQEVETVPHASPVAYLGDALLDALGFVGAVWLIHQIVMGFLFLLPWLLVAAVFALILRTSGTKQPDPNMP